MTVRELYSRKKFFPYVSFGVSLVCIAVTCLVYLRPDLYQTLAFRHPPEKVWQVFTGIFVHGTEGSAAGVTFAHLAANLIMFLPFSILMEKTLEYRRYVICLLSAWIGCGVAFQIISAMVIAMHHDPSGVAVGAGLSGVSYFFIAMGAYTLIVYLHAHKNTGFRQPLTYVLLLILIGAAAMLNPFVAGSGSFALHLVGVGTGLVLAFMFRKTIKAAVTD